MPSQLSCGTGGLHHLQHLTSWQLFGLNQTPPFSHRISGPFGGVSVETQLLLKVSAPSPSGRDSSRTFPPDQFSLWMGCLLADPPDEGLSLDPAWQLLCYTVKQQLNSKSHRGTQALGTWTIKSPQLPGGKTQELLP